MIVELEVSSDLKNSVPLFRLVSHTCFAPSCLTRYLLSCFCQLSSSQLPSFLPSLLITIPLLLRGPNDLSVRVSSFLLVDISGSPILPIALNFLKKFFNMKNFKHTLKEIIFNRTPSAYFMINNILPFLPHVILLKYFQANTRHHDA